MHPGPDVVGILRLSDHTLNPASMTWTWARLGHGSRQWLSNVHGAKAAHQSSASTALPDHTQPAANCAGPGSTHFCGRPKACPCPHFCIAHTHTRFILAHSIFLYYMLADITQTLPDSITAGTATSIVRSARFALALWLMAQNTSSLVMQCKPLRCDKRTRRHARKPKKTVLTWK